jgi:hypothetical protein
MSEKILLFSGQKMRFSVENEILSHINHLSQHNHMYGVLFKICDFSGLAKSRFFAELVKRFLIRN